MSELMPDTREETPPAAREEIRALLVEDNSAFARMLDLLLSRHAPERFLITRVETGAAALELLEGPAKFDVILLDYFLPDMSGVQLMESLRHRGVSEPVVFLTVNRDFDLAREVLKLGVQEYVLKEELSLPLFSGTILDAIRRHRLREELMALEIASHRLDAVRELIVQITNDVREPLDAMRRIYEELARAHPSDQMAAYLAIIRDNHLRIENKIVRLKELKSDRTVPYIKDIKMFDIS